jgi:bis(5'-nucleosyl)-tetraphosphatase (symmetrical)
MNYLLGDVQGCDAALERMLLEIGFSPSRDRIVVLGDLVNRGPDSLTVLRRLLLLGSSAVCLLGNHDLHLLALADGTRKQRRGDTLTAVLEAPDLQSLIEWLRHRSLACLESGWLCVHAGVVPQWDAADVLARAAEVETLLRSDLYGSFLEQMYGDAPTLWDDGLRGMERIRFIVNVLTRTRFCSAAGELDLATKEGVNNTPPGLYAWFAVPGRRTFNQAIAFGHWSTLGLIMEPNLLSLDTGCVWGGALTAVRVDGGRREAFQIQCRQARRPGA